MLAPARRLALAGRCTLALVLCAPLAARAQPTPPAAASAPAPDQAAIDSAKRHFMQAIALYNDGNFNAALAEFQAAYATKPAPSILYNIGLTYKALFLYNDAIRSLDQYLREETKLQPERKAEVEQLLREMRALLADVSLAVSPEGAAVKVDGRTIGRAPIGQYLLSAGRHVLEVSADGYVAQQKELMVTAGVPMAVSIALVVIPKTGRVRVEAQPVDAAIKIDQRGYPPPVDVELPLGGHTLEIAARGYVTHREELLVAPGQTRDVRVSLRRPPVYKRTGFIVGMTFGALILAGGVAAGICKPAHCYDQDAIIPGTLNPGSGNVGR
jgi:hypothetical protein